MSDHEVCLLSTDQASLAAGTAMGSTATGAGSFGSGFFEPVSENRLGMRRRPAIGQQIHQIRRTKSQVDRMMLRRIGQLCQYVLEVIVHHQMMSQSAADHTK